MTPTLAVVDGCADFASLPDALLPIESKPEPSAFFLRLQMRGHCAPLFDIAWRFPRAGSASAPRVEVKPIKTCGPKPRVARPTPLAIAPDSFHPMAPPLALLDDPRAVVRGAALQSALRRQTNPAVCEAIDAKLAERPLSEAVAIRIANGATEPCLVDSLVQLLVEYGLPQADAALARIVESPVERFRLLAAATERGVVAPALVRSLPQPLSHAETERLLAFAQGKDAELRVVETVFQHLSIALGRRHAAGLLLGQLGAFSTAAQAFLLEQPEVRDHLASLPQQEFAELPLHPSVTDSERFELLGRRLDAQRRLSDDDWARLVRALPPSTHVDAVSLRAALGCVPGRPPAQVPPEAADALLGAGYSLRCATSSAVDDDQALDPTDFDRFDAAPMALPTTVAETEERAPEDDADQERLAAKDTVEDTRTEGGSSEDRTESNRKDEDDAEESDSLRARFFNGGFSIAPFLDATAFFQGPMAGGGLMGAWHINERFSLVALASATFTCTICLDGTTGARTDLRIDAGASANLFTESDVTPYARITVAAMHIEIVDIRRASFHDAIGPELTIGIDWLPIPGARLFLETGAFWAFEVTRSVRPAGQVAPSPRGVPPVDGSTFGVAARLGMTLGL